MSLFGIGGSTSSSRSRSDSSSFDNLDSSGFNLGGSESRSRVAFEDIFASLFGGASSAAGMVNTDALSQNASLLFGAGTGFLDTLRGGGAGTDYLRNELGRSSGVVDEQIGLLSSDLGEFLTETVNPAIKASGIQAGTLGGGRGEVARGLAAEGATEEFVRGSTAIRQGERDRLTGIAESLASDTLGRTQAGLGALPGVMGLAESSALSGLSPFAALSQILGGPTVLQDASAFDVGGSSSIGRAGSRSTSRSRSDSRSLNLDFI